MGAPTKSKIKKLRLYAILFIFGFQIYFFLGNMAISYLAAFILSMSFEAPIMGLEKILLSLCMPDRDHKGIKRGSEPALQVKKTG